MKVIVGLGNPEEKYKTTYHNLGFIAVEDVAINFNVKFKKNACRALIAEANYNGEKIIIAKPQTYMNLSGESVRELLGYYKVPTKDLIVIYDDYDLVKGSLRIRESGSAGTHNGMRNIVKELGSDKFARIRVGFKPLEESRIPLIDYVLSGIKGDDVLLFDKMTQVAGEAGFEFAKGTPIQQVMQKYNLTK